MTPAPSRAPRPATTIVVAGYGALTSGILPHLAALPDTCVALASRHLTRSPHPDVTLVAPAQIADLCPEVIIGCFETDIRARTFWTHKPIADTIGEHRPACIELSTISPGRAVQWHQEIAALGAVAWESPVTGSRPGARAGTLTAFLHASAPHQGADRALAAFTDHRHAFTAPGNPARFKLIFNAWGAALLHAAGEFARHLPTHLGADYPVAAHIVTTEGWMAALAAQKLERIEQAAYDDPDFALHHMIKDLGHARDLLGNLPLISSTLAAFTAAQHLHGPYADFTAVADTRTRGAL